VTLTAKDVAEITRLLEQSTFDELYLELDGVKLSLRRGGGGAPAGSASQAPAAAERLAPVAESARAAPASTFQGSAARAAGGAADSNVHAVPAPLLGTFYRAPKPGASPFVEVGSTVEEETIIGIIEVMKLMNTVRAGVRGRVVEILARDGVLVEYDEVLMRVDQTG
jgi:acetyl-CoA carboxylase biotin carboxyl carrier protein